MMTFDDGGVSAWTTVAERLEGRGWRGHFFIATDFINTPGVLSSEQIRDLHRRGHVVGSHSCSHPLQMRRLSSQDIFREWKDSAQILSSILGQMVQVASVPGGQYYEEVGHAASVAGIRVLFTSEPTDRHTHVGNCLILGRYAIRRRISPQTAAAIAQGCLGPRLYQSINWKVKKIAKALGGQQYLRIRQMLSHWAQK
jgi:peptidoglycan/xylan/chitin deacetylase (PgdA/CDA1 family)